MMVIFYKRIICADAKMLKYSAISGALLSGIFIALMYGMKPTTASSAVFLTSSIVILVPILQTLITRKLPRKNIIYGVMLVSIGLALLTINDKLSLAIGFLYCMVAAFLYALYHCNQWLCSKD